MVASRFSLQIHFRGLASLENPLSFFVIHEFKLISSYHHTHSQMLKDVINSARLYGEWHSAYTFCCARYPRLARRTFPT